MQGCYTCVGQCLGQFQQNFCGDATAAHTGADVDFVNKAVHAAKLNRPAEGHDDIANRRTGGANDVDRTIGSAFEQRSKRRVPVGVVLSDALFFVEGGHQRQHLLKMLGPGEV